jgi:hypothetical protein
MVTTTNVLRIIIQVVDKATAGLKKAKQATEDIDKNLKKVNKNSFRFLGLGLGLLFQGLALQRVFGGALRSMFNSFNKIIDVQDEFFQQTQALRASFEFLKFSIIDALGQSEIIQNIIDLILTITDRFNQLSTEAKSGLGVLIVFGFLASTIMVQIGQNMLFLIGVSSALNIPLGVLTRRLFLIGVFGLLAVGIFGLLKTDALDPLTKVLILIGTLLTALGIKLLFVVGIAKLPVLLFGLLLLVVAGLIIKFGSLGNVIKQFASLSIIALGILADFIITALLTPIQLLAVGLIALIELMNKVAGTQISTGGLRRFADFRPTFGTKAAAFADRVGLIPEPVTESPLGTIIGGIGEEIKNGVIGALEGLGRTVGDAVGDALEEQAVVLPTTER